MNPLVKYILLLAMGLEISNSQAQLIQTGQWRSHLSYKDAKICEASNRYVYAASQQGFFRVLNASNEIEKLGKSEGFHGAEVSALFYFKDKDILLIGYSDGNIDLLNNDQTIVNIPGFYAKLLQGDKSILHAYFSGNNALVSTYFGLLVIDLTNNEINDSYSSIGPNGISIPVLSSLIVGDSVYIGTDKGIRFAKWSRLVNLNDFTQWSWLFEGKPCTFLSPLGQKIVFESDSFVYSIEKGISALLLPDKRGVARIWNNEFGTHVVRGGNIYTYYNGTIVKESINLVVGATQFKDKLFWFCTGIGPGLIKKAPGGEIAFMPDGPSDPSIFKMTQTAPNILASGGGVSSTFGNTFNNAGFYIYLPGGWKNNLSSSFNTNMYDFSYVHFQKSRGWYLAATHSNGILVMRALNNGKGESENFEIINRFDDVNSPLKRLPPLNLIRVSGMAEDSKGNLWIANYGSTNPLICYTKSGQWKSFDLPSNEVKNLVIDNLDRKWMILQSGGIQVFDEGKLMDNMSDDRSVIIGTKNGLLSNDILSIQSDKLGYVWIGSNQGLNVYTGSSLLFTNPKIDRFIVEQDGLVGYLMGEESINDICVDGGNRKWMATNNGLFLVEPYGQSVILHFNKENSPLLSDRIVCLGQVSSTGEIFVGTDRGITSYRSDANDAKENFEKIKVYPNPVSPSYDGLITIEGLTSNAEVKITDATGKLIYQTKANGGKATWNGLRHDGTKPNSGVLIVFAVNSDGSETAMGKFIYMHKN